MIHIMKKKENKESRVPWEEACQQHLVFFADIMTELLGTKSLLLAVVCTSSSYTLATRFIE